MTAPSVGLAQILNAEGIATSGTDMFVGEIPDTVTGLCLLILDSGGPSPNPRWTRDFRDVQIVVRSNVNDYATGWTKAEAVKNKLLGLAPQTIGTDVYASFLMRGDIVYIGRDDNNRPRFSINFRLIIDGPDVGNRSSL